jgi:hypothetical protein
MKNIGKKEYSKKGQNMKNDMFKNDPKTPKN